MDEMFADWYAKADREPTEERLESRSAGVDAFLSDASADRLLALVRFLGKRNSEDADVATLQDAMKEHDTTFRLRDNDQELRVLSSIALTLSIKRESSFAVGTALAVDVASALGTQELGPLGTDLTEMAQRFLLNEGRVSRAEPDPIQKKMSKLPVLDAGELSLPQPGVDVAQVQQNYEHLATYVGSLSACIKSLGTPLRTLETNQERLAAAYRFNRVLAEECSMLWWLTGGHSRAGETPLSSLSEDALAFVVGRDLADLTRISPGPLSIQAIMRRALDSAGIVSSSSLALFQVVDACDREWRTTWLAGKDLVWLRGIGRCLPAVACSVELGEGAEWRQLADRREGVDSASCLSHLQWARLCYGECLLMKWYESQHE